MQYSRRNFFVRTCPEQHFQFTAVSAHPQRSIYQPAFLSGSQLPGLSVSAYIGLISVSTVLWSIFNFKGSVALRQKFVKQFFNFREKTVQCSPTCKLCYSFPNLNAYAAPTLPAKPRFLFVQRMVCSQNTFPTMNHMRWRLRASSDILSSEPMRRA